MKLEDYQIPCDIQAEKMLISQILIDNEILYYVNDLWLKQKDFYDKQTKKAYWDILKTIKKWLTADMITIDVDDEISWLALSTSDFKYYTKSIKEKAIKREIMKESWFIETITRQDKTDIKDIQELIDKMLQKSMKIDIQKSYKDSLYDYYKELQEPKTKQIKTWYSIIDNVIKLKKWQLITIAWRPWMWKSAVMWSLALNMKSCFISIEMSRQELTYRFVANITGIDYKIIDNWLNNCNQEIQDKIANWFWILKEKTIDVLDKRISFIDIKMELKRQKMMNDIDIAFIDYLQIIRVEDTKQIRALQIWLMTRELKALAKELDIVIVIWSQLNREVEKRPWKPRLSDLRESWDIEQDSDIVIFVERDIEDEPEKLDLIIAKYRNWKPCDLEMKFQTKTMKLLNERFDFKWDDNESIF